jgi:hypothetical protein
VKVAIKILVVLQGLLGLLCLLLAIDMLGEKGAARAQDVFVAAPLFVLGGPISIALIVISLLLRKLSPRNWDSLPNWVIVGIMLAVPAPIVLTVVIVGILS